MIQRIIDFFIRPYNLGKTKVFLFTILISVFLVNVLYIKLSKQNDFFEFMSQNITPTIVLILLLVVFFYMIYVDSNDAKRKARGRDRIYDIFENPDVSDSLKERLADRLDNHL